MSRKYTEKAWMVLTLARQLSDGFKHGYIGSEHLLLALCMVFALCAVSASAESTDPHDVILFTNKTI